MYIFVAIWKISTIFFARPTANAPTQMSLKGFLLILKLGYVMIIIVQFYEVKHCVKVRRLVCTHIGIGSSWLEKRFKVLKNGEGEQNAPLLHK